ncbi:MAG: PfkB family carbohydrate kinase [Myxococcota bacterium]|jgi:rfaE bifunctional protein kinase chain/domain
MKKLERLIRSFKGRRVVVAGDIVADEFVYGRTNRLSREAPVPIVRYERADYMPGGAANAANNVAAMGGVVVPVGVVGMDEPGRQMVAMFQDRGVDTGGLIQDRNRPTVSKTRILAGDIGTVMQQMLRLDRGGFGDVTGKLRLAVVERFRKAVQTADCVIFSDYGEGVLCDHMRDEMLAIARRRGVVITADSRFKVHMFAGVHAVTPNLPELMQFARRDLIGVEEIEKAAASLQRKTGARGVLVKRGSNGMAVYKRGKPFQIYPPHGSAEVADVTGAGDTVIAAFSLALLAGAEMNEAAQIANIAGGIKVTKRGTATVSTAEILRELHAISRQEE